jgi:hypothetical protein
MTTVELSTPRMGRSRLDGRRSRARRSSITTLGTPAEVTRQEIRIEPFTQRLVAVLVTQEENLPSSDNRPLRTSGSSSE